MSAFSPEKRPVLEEQQFPLAVDRVRYAGEAVAVVVAEKLCAHLEPSFDITLTEDPTCGNPLPVKGGGEAGITPALAVVMSAIMDALKDYGVDHMDMPATPAASGARSRRQREATTDDLHRFPATMPTVSFLSLRAVVHLLNAHAPLVLVRDVTQLAR